MDVCVLLSLRRCRSCREKIIILFPFSPKSKMIDSIKKEHLDYAEFPNYS